VGIFESTISASSNMLATSHGEKLYVHADASSHNAITFSWHLCLVMFGAFAAGWGIPAIALAIALIFSGVSFRFGGKKITQDYDTSIVHGLTFTKIPAISTTRTALRVFGYHYLFLQG
jgi:hypothetical protein